MKMNRKLLIIFIFFMVVGLFFARETIRMYLNEYAVRVTQEQFGSRSLEPEQEEKIRRIVDEVKITESIIIRKMNHQALCTIGYHNAFAYFPQFLNCIPLSNQPFLFFSEGFFEDLSPEEQQFLIGHELTHVKEHHFQYLNLMWLFGVILLLLIVWWLKRNWLTSFIGNRVPFNYQFYAMVGCVSLLSYMSLVIPNLCSMAYRRHSEWVADETSLNMLNSHDGALKLFERWQKDFKMPDHYPFYGLFATHPDIKERKTHCLNLKNKSKEIV